jgi:perosamine synthetase
MGRYTAKFEEMFASFSNAKHAVSCSNGTSALELILRGLGIEGKSVIVPTNTFLATAYAVMHSGNKVIFADSDPDTLCLDPNSVEKQFTSDTAAVIGVHIGGIISPAIHDLTELCRSKGAYFIEDCAHAHGCTIEGRPAGTLGIAGGFSFFPTKVLVTGEGGMVTTNDDELASHIRMIRNHGKNPTVGNRMSEFGHNYRMNEFAALLGVQQMMKAEEIIQDRRRVAAFYDAALAQADGIRPLSLPSNVYSTYYKYVAYLDEGIDRTAFKAALKERFKVSLTGEVYADLCHTEPLWKEFSYCGSRLTQQGPASCTRWPQCACRTPQDGFPGAEYISRNHVCLPVYPGLTQEQLEHVVSSINTVLNESKKEKR